MPACVCVCSYCVHLLLTFKMFNIIENIVLHNYCILLDIIYMFILEHCTSLFLLLLSRPFASFSIYLHLCIVLLFLFNTCKKAVIYCFNY